jgi:hypothetical protein
MVYPTQKQLTCSMHSTPQHTLVIGHMYNQPVLRSEQQQFQVRYIMHSTPWSRATNMDAGNTLVRNGVHPTDEPCF